jgi:polar amino acid transport system permease protein
MKESSSSSGNNILESSEPIETRVSMLDHLLIWALRVPWWAVMLGAGVIFLSYSLLSNESNRSVLEFLADRPSFKTDDLYDVAYQVEEEVLILNETVVVRDIERVRITISRDDVVSEVENGEISCPADASFDCLILRGTVVTYRDYDFPEGVEPDGTEIFEGIVVGEAPFGTGRSIQLQNGGIVVTFERSIISEREGEWPCNRLEEPTCETLSGRIVTFERDYILKQGVLRDDDVTVRFLLDGFVNNVNPVKITDRHQGILPCGSDDPENCLEIPVYYATHLTNVTGIETKNTDDYVEVRTVEQQMMEISYDQVISMEPGMVACDREADARCEDFQGTIIRLKGEVLTGLLTLEDDTHYRILFEDKDEAIRYNRRDILDEVRDPIGCLYTDQDPSCKITITLGETTVQGRVEDTGSGYRVETVPEKVVSIDQDDIFKTSRRVPEGCALNNIRGCDKGIWLTFFVTFTAYGFALIIGIILGLMRVSSNPILYHISTLYVELVRGVPLIVLLVYFAFVISPEVRDIAGIGWVFDQLDAIEIQIFGVNSKLSEAIIGLSVGYGAFLAEVFRAGIQSISRGQMEAARSLGMSYFESMRHIILPQAIRVVLPPLGNDFIAMLKDTSLIAVLALPELFQLGRLRASESFKVVEVYTSVALLYIIMTVILSLMVRLIERWARLP